MCDDSRSVTEGSLFAVMPKAEAYIDQAIEQGATVIMIDRVFEDVYVPQYPEICWVMTDDPRRTFHSLAARFYGDPSKKIRTVGVTGTNGKTTITYLIESIFHAAERATAVIGTIDRHIGKKSFSTKNTTPGFLENQEFFADLLKEGVDHAVMEVSSHALAQGRVDEIDIATAIFTNLSGDHLDYHGDMEGYFAAKSLMFLGLSDQANAVINYDDVYGQRLFQRTEAKIITYGLAPEADVRAEIKASDLKGMHLEIFYPEGSCELFTPMIGKHNVYNILAAFACGLVEGISVPLIVKGLQLLAHVPGRLERVINDRNLDIFIDYAHTDDGLKNVLESLKKIEHNSLIVVFGCGGDRDRTKRSRMGRVAEELSDMAIVTSDNPRSEEPMDIIREIEGGMGQKNYEVYPDRQDAIIRAINIATPGDIVLLAGKGHETYQILKDETIDLDERVIVAEALKKRAK